VKRTEKVPESIQNHPGMARKSKAQKVLRAHFLMKRSFTYLLLFCSVLSFAQTPAPEATASPEQCLIGFYQRDSIAIRLPGAQPQYDIINAANKNLYNLRAKQVIVYDRWLTMKDDTSKNSTAAGKKEVETALKEVTDLRADSLKEEKKIHNAYAQLKPVYAKVDHVADSIGKSRGLKQVRDVADNSEMICPPDRMLMTDITNDVTIGLHMKPKLVKIGLYNADSLMRLMPGYKILADSAAMELLALQRELAIRQLPIDEKQRELDTMRKTWSRKQIANREKEIAQLQDEYDTYRGNELYKLDVRDSLRTEAYRKKFRAALAASIKEQGCFRVYEIHEPQTDWTTKEAEFINLNATIAAKLLQ
jgi:Skp family chaperone for outer membrane proteins